jgi:hygromycin-B 7''-O-kinase
VTETDLVRKMLSDYDTVVRRPGGQSNAIYEVHARGEALIVKVYDERWRWKQAKEVHVYQMLAEHGVGPVPAIFEVLPAAATVMTLLPGQPLSEVTLSPDETRAVYRQMGSILAKIHGIRQRSYGYLTTRILDPVHNNTAYMTRQFAKKLREFNECGGDPALHEAIQAYVGERTGVFAQCESPVLCHNDFHEGNVLVAAGDAGWRVTGFIDVENAIAADPLMDLAKTDYYGIKDRPAKLSGLLDGYGPLPAGWADRLAIYRLYHALELWDWFASIGNSGPLPGIAADIKELVDGKREWA